MNKGVGFNRNIKRDWLDAAASLLQETHDPALLRARLEPIVGQEISPENTRKTIDILLNIWLKSGAKEKRLKDAAAAFFQQTNDLNDRLWLHYGLTVITYPMFAAVAGVIGRMGRHEEGLSAAAIKKRVMAELGQVGSLDVAMSRVIFSLRDWGLVANGAERNSYILRYQVFSTSNQALESWLLACVLTAHPAEEIPFADLIHLPLLFPFCIALTPDTLRQSSWFTIQRQGLGLDMVRLST